MLIDISSSFLILGGVTSYSKVITSYRDITSSRSGSTSYSTIITGYRDIIGSGGVISLGGVTCLGSYSIPYIASIISSFASSFTAKLSSIESIVLAISVRSTSLLKGSMWSSDIGVLV